VIEEPLPKSQSCHSDFHTNLGRPNAGATAEPAVLYLQQVEERQIDQQLRRAALEASLLQQIHKHKEDAKLHPWQNEGPDAT
jgi:hypothetical protein